MLFTMSSMSEVRLERIKKLEHIRNAGIDPYPADSHPTRTIDSYVSAFSSLDEKETLVGRIMSLRVQGGLAFFDIFDGTGKVQIVFQKDASTPSLSYEFFLEVIDRGDFVEVTGTPYTTKRGQQSLLLAEWRILSKSLRPIPDSWYGIKDEDERYRQRYLDILLSDELRDTVQKRSIFWNTIRSFLLSRDFVEVETPVLENTPGGAEARPFVTHHNALELDVYLRISAGELWQKKLLVAGMPRTFEIGRIFRNEGMSREHLQDYTQMECYMAYSDYTEGMRMTQDLYREIAEKTFSTTSFTIRDQTVDLGGEWPLLEFGNLMKEHYGFDVLDAPFETLLSELDRQGISYEKTMEKGRILDLLWKSVRKTIAGPAFLIGVPVELEPLAKRRVDDPRVVERFQVLIAGSEVGKGFSELNDPRDQYARFMEQQKLRDQGDDEAQMADLEFVEALEYGMPPAFGFGVSERLFSFLMDVPIREAQLFPLLKPNPERTLDFD
jgi:lysyl-tRNA synthetase class 2